MQGRARSRATCWRMSAMARHPCSRPEPPCPPWRTPTCPRDAEAAGNYDFFGDCGRRHASERFRGRWGLHPAGAPNTCMCPKQTCCNCGESLLRIQIRARVRFRKAAFGIRTPGRPEPQLATCGGDDVPAEGAAGRQVRSMCIAAPLGKQALCVRFTTGMCAKRANPPSEKRNTARATAPLAGAERLFSRRPVQNSQGSTPGGGCHGGAGASARPSCFATAETAAEFHIFEKGR